MKTALPSINTAVSVSLVVLATTAQATPCTNTVCNTLDSGPGSLRYALENATYLETITFSPSVTGTIKLTSGQLTVSNAVTIVGPGANVLAVDGNGSNRVFYVAGFHSFLPVSISGLTISNGYTSGNGGGIDNEQPVQGSMVPVVTLTVSNCVVTGNHGNNGGGIYNNGIQGGGMLEIYNCTLSGNTAASGGAVMNDGEGPEGSMLGANPVVVEIYNSTISSNSSPGSGGAILNESIGGADAIVRFFNSTLSGNFSGSGGGIESDSDSYGPATLEIGSTILNAATLATVGGEILSGGYNLSSDDGGGFLGATGDQIFTDPMLGPLQLNGGQTPTHALFGASPAVDAGKNFSGLATDQRGPGFARTVDISLSPNVGDGTDIGAFELQASEFHPQPPTITSTNATTFITGYFNSFRIVATGAPFPALYETGTLPAGTGWTNGILSGTPPLGSGGIYPLTVTASNGVAPMATQYFTLTVVEPCSTVQNNQDSGPGSLRFALALATNHETITFCPSVTGTIKLTSGELAVFTGVSIVGPGANVLALDGNGSNPVFYVEAIASTVSISGLTITNGYATNTIRYDTNTTGGIENVGSLLTLSNCVVTGNHGVYGGGIYSRASGGGAPERC